MRDGIDDGFLTPFKVRQMASKIDSYVYDPNHEVISGEIDEDRAYTESDLNTKIIIEERELSRILEFIDQINPRQKTQVFAPPRNTPPPSATTSTRSKTSTIRTIVNV